MYYNDQGQYDPDEQFNIRTHRSGRAAAGKRKNRLRQTGRFRRASAAAAAEVRTAAAAVQMSAALRAAAGGVQAAAVNGCGSAGRESEKKESGNAAS